MNTLKFQENDVFTSKSIDFSRFSKGVCSHMHVCGHTHAHTTAKFHTFTEKGSTGWSKKEIRACVEELEFLGVFYVRFRRCSSKTGKFLWSLNWPHFYPELPMLLLSHFHFVFDCNCFDVLVTPKSLTIFPGPLEWSSLVIYFMRLIFLG